MSGWACTVLVQIPGTDHSEFQEAIQQNPFYRIRGKVPKKLDHVPSEAGSTPAPQRCCIMSVARRRARAKKEATRRADVLPTCPCGGSTSLRDRLRSERPPAAVLECGEQPRAGRFMLETRARSVLMIEPSEGAILFPTWLATTVHDTKRLCTRIAS